MDWGEGEEEPAVANNALVVAHEEEAAAGGASPSLAAAAEVGVGTQPGGGRIPGVVEALAVDTDAVAAAAGTASVAGRGLAAGAFKLDHL